jgi:hypothetical protein
MLQVNMLSWGYIKVNNGGYMLKTMPMLSKISLIRESYRMDNVHLLRLVN